MKSEGTVKWYLRPMSVVLLLFFVLGPFGLPLLYKSFGFTRKWKIVLTILVIIYTSYLITLTLEFVGDFYRIFAD
jgi:hypothetical protein